MSYTKQTWANGDIITAAKLNHMEDGIAGVEADVSSLDTQLLASMPHDTASGSIASFPDGAAMPVIDCSVAVAPNQNLNGYDNPWPAGGGKNLLDASTVTGTTSSTVTVSSDGKRIDIVATSGGYNCAKIDATSLVGKGDFYLSFYAERTSGSQNSVSCNGDYRLNGATKYDGISSSRAYVNDKIQATDLVVNFPEGATNAEIKLYINNHATLPTGGISGYFENVRLCKEQSQPWTPYSNICPISGWTECKVTRTGKNLCANNLTFTSGIRDDNGNQTSSSFSHYSNEISVKPNTTYTLQGAKIQDTNYRVYYLDASKGWISKTAQIVSATYTFTTPSNCNYIQVQCANEVDLTTAQLELGSTATAYEPYQGQTYTIDLNGTRYGGTLDVTTGKLTVDRWYVLKPSCGNPLDQTNPAVILSLSVQAAAGVNSVANPKLISNCAKTLVPNYQYANSVLGISLNSTSQIRLSVPSLTTKAQYEAWINDNNFEVVYPLATPIEVDLTPTEITTLLGTNNIFADCGDTTVDYYADTTLFVNKKIAAAVAALS